MEFDINIRVSNRHVHLRKETYDLLFDEPLTKKYDLNQIGEFASNQTLTIRVGDKKLENVRVLGAFRKYDQVEISKRDARFLEVNPPVRGSGELDDALEVILETEKASIKVKGLIIANRHVHMSYDDAKKYGVKDKQKVGIKIDNDKAGVVMAEIKVSDTGYYELHFDTDDANAFLIEDNDKAKMIL